MQLRDYLELKGQTVTEFASEVHARLGHDPDDELRMNATVTRVWRHVNGKRSPKPTDIVLYEELTKGAVTVSDWLTLALDQRPPPPDDAAEPVAATG
jgi:hypothetical protein